MLIKYLKKEIDRAEKLFEFVDNCERVLFDNNVVINDTISLFELKNRYVLALRGLEKSINNLLNIVKIKDDVNDEYYELVNDILNLDREKLNKLIDFVKNLYSEQNDVS